MAIPDEKTLRRALAAYPEVVARQGVERLPELDRWYREELPALVSARTPGYITLEELIRLTEWKMARGVWRAPNLVLVRENAPDLVEETSAAAFSLIPDPRKPAGELTKLRGVGAATASAPLAAVAPDVYPFFDELVAEQLPGLGKVAWTLPYYVRYVDAMRAAAAGLGGDWTPALLERALWAHGGGKAEIAIT